MTAPASTRLIGLALLDPSTALEAAHAAGVSPAWMDTEYAKAAWQAITAMEAEGRPIDEHFVAEYAAAHGMELPSEYLAECVRVAPSRRNGADELVATLRREYIARECRSVAAMLQYEEGDPVEIAAAAAEQLMALASTKQTRDKEAIRAEIEREWDNAAQGIMSGVPCPLPRLYEQSGGAPLGMVTVLVAHGGTGKSALSLQWADYAATHGWPCVYFPFEDMDIGAYRRLAGMRSGISPFKLMMGKADPEEIARGKQGLVDALASPLIIDSERGTIHDLGARIQRYVAKHGIRAVFVDAIKDIDSTKDGIERDNEIIDGLDRIAKRHRIAVIATHHVRKSPSTATDYQSWHIDRDDLRGSGRIWDTARQVIALQMYPKVKAKRYPVVTQGSAFQYYWQILKNNHGVAHIRRELFRHPTLAWEEVSDVDAAMTYIHEA